MLDLHYQLLCLRNRVFLTRIQKMLNCKNENKEVSKW